MRTGWVGVVSCMLLGGCLATACGDAFTEAGTHGDDGGNGDDATANDANGGGDVAALEGGAIDGGIDAHHDATSDAAADTSMADTSPADTSPADTSMADTSMADTAPQDTGPVGDACTLVVADETNGVFVSTSGTASGCGSRAVPCNSIQTALNAAQSTSKPYVYVDNGTYLESITLVSNVTILGGWADVGGNWSRLCGATNAASVILKAPANASTTITANNVTGAAIDTLTVESKGAGSVGTGESIYGIFATGSTSLTLTNVSVSVVGGGAGSSGGTGGAGTNGAGTCSPSSDGANGGTGSGGASGAVGSFSAAGYTPATGGTGGTGATGHNGTLTAPTCVNGGSCDVNGDDSCAGTITVSGQVCGTAGAAGCPGTGSTGGTGGAGGGSSIALYVWGAGVTIGGGALTSGDGAGGGPGGSGGAGVGRGSPGTTGNSAIGAPTSCITHTFGTPPNIVYTCTNGTHLTAAGGVGGAGGNGGPGAQGGGGAGGSSYSYYFGGGGSVSASGTTFAFGNPGSGGSGGNAGASGAAAAHN